MSVLRREGNKNVTCTICRNYGYMVMNCQLRNPISNNGPWRIIGMSCFHCHKVGYLARDYRYKNHSPSNEDWKDNKIINPEEIKK